MRIAWEQTAERECHITIHIIHLTIIIITSSYFHMTGSKGKTLGTLSTLSFFIIFFLFNS